MEDTAISRHPLNITFTIPQPTHCSRSVARKLHLQEEMSVENPGGRVHSPPNIQRSDHNHRAEPSDANDQQTRGETASVCTHFLAVSQESLQIKMERWICLWASSRVVLAHCTFGLSFFKAPHICGTGNSRAALYVAVQS